MTYKTSMESLEALTAAVEAAGVDIAPDYSEFLRLAFAIATDCGEAGRDCFHRLCRLYPDYKRDATDRMFNGALKSGRGEVHLGTAFHMAQAKGVECKHLFNEWEQNSREEREDCVTGGRMHAPRRKTARRLLTRACRSPSSTLTTGPPR